MIQQPRSLEPFRAFVPKALPPDPPLRIEGALARRLERAGIALGRLDGLISLLPDPSLFLYTYVRQEAVLSSQIEGTQSSLSDLLLFEIEEAPGVPIVDVHEVSNYVRAMEHGLERLKEGFPLSNRLLREIHAILLEGVRGGEKDPGEFRRSQNWIGGSRPGNARYVPPPPERVPELMSDLEKFLHAEIPVLVKAGIAHAQFETIHPFLDGNGRIGRLLITLIFCKERTLRAPILYLSLFFKEHQQAYYDALQSVRKDGDWEGWLDFYLEGIEEVAGRAAETARKLDAMFHDHRARLHAGRGSSTTVVALHELLKKRIFLTRNLAEKSLKVTWPTADKAMKALLAAGIAAPIPGRKRDRLYCYKPYLEILREGIEATPPATGKGEES